MPLIRVVGAALIRDGQVLAARRVRPAGGWEFPGGKVEPGERPAAALERECREELGIRVRAIVPVATVSDERIELQVWHADIVDGTPVAGSDHDELRWLDAGGLSGVAWLPIDRTVLPAVARLLADPGQS